MFPLPRCSRVNDAGKAHLPDLPRPVLRGALSFLPSEPSVTVPDGARIPCDFRRLLTNGRRPPQKQQRRKNNEARKTVGCGHSHTYRSGWIALEWLIGKRGFYKSAVSRKVTAKLKEDEFLKTMSQVATLAPSTNSRTCNIRRGRIHISSKSARFWITCHRSSLVKEFISPNTFVKI